MDEEHSLKMLKYFFKHEIQSEEIVALACSGFDANLFGTTVIIKVLLKMQ